MNVEGGSSSTVTTRVGLEEANVQVTGSTQTADKSSGSMVLYTVPPGGKSNGTFTVGATSRHPRKREPERDDPVRTLRGRQQRTDHLRGGAGTICLKTGTTTNGLAAPTLTINSATTVTLNHRARRI